MWSLNEMDQMRRGWQNSFQLEFIIIVGSAVCFRDDISNF